MHSSCTIERYLSWDTVTSVSLKDRVTSVSLKVTVTSVSLKDSVKRVSLKDTVTSVSLQDISHGMHSSCTIERCQSYDTVSFERYHFPSSYF